MSHWTTFAGLAAPDPGESTDVLNGDFIYHNPDLIDQFLRVGAVSHRHDGHTALALPQAPATLTTVGSAGALPNGTTYYVSYTTVDARGGETIGSPPAQVTTPAGIQPASGGPSASADYAGGIMPAGNYAYAVTYTDGAGGETNLGPTTWVFLDPGFASAQVKLAGLSAGLAGHGGAGINWRLWRSYEGEDWHLVTQGSGDAYTDAGFDPPDNPARPPDVTDNEAGANSIVVKLPTSEPSYTNAASINIYLSTDPGLASPAFYLNLPIACAGTSLVVTTDDVNYGQPPEVSTSTAGAGRIFPDTDLVFGVKSPVNDANQLPSGTVGDIRLVLDTLDLAAYTPSGWAFVGGGTWKSPVPTASGLPPIGNQAGDARVSMDTNEIWIWHAGSAAPKFIQDNNGTNGGIATDNTYVYWANNASPSGSIGRAKQDGTGVNSTFIPSTGGASGLASPTDVVVASGASAGIFWVNDESPIGVTIGRANLDGTGVNPYWYNPGDIAPGVIATDGQYLYFDGSPSAGTGFGIYRIGLDGSTLTKLASPQGATPTVTSLAAYGGRVYWAQFDNTNPLPTMSTVNWDGTSARYGVFTLDGKSYAMQANANGVWWSVQHHFIDTGPGSYLDIGHANLDLTSPNPVYWEIGRDATNWAVGFTGFAFASGGASYDFFFNDIGFPDESDSYIGLFEHGFWTPAVAFGTGGGGGGISSILASAGSASGLVTALEFAGSAGAQVQFVGIGGGSGVVLISASGTQGPQGPTGPGGPQGPPGAGVGVGGSAFTPLIDPASYVEFVASGGASVGVTSLGGGSARVSITAAGTGGGTSSGAVGRAWRQNSLSVNSWTKVPLDTLSFGTMDITNGRFVAPSAGVYHVDGEVTFTSTATEAAMVGIYVNGVLNSRGSRRDDQPNSGGHGYVVSDILNLNAGDHVELYAFAGAATSLNLSGQPDCNYLSVYSVQGLPGSPGPAGPAGSTGPQGPQGPSGSGGITSFVASAGSASATIGPFLGFAGSGGTSVELIPQSNGSAVVLISASATAGAQGPTGPQGPQGPPGTGSGGSFVASAGSASASVGPFLGFAGSAGTNVELVQQGPSAIILISASGIQGPQGPQGAQGPAGTGGGGGGSITIAASGGASAVSPDAYIEFDASGGVGLSIASALGGTSAQVLIGAPPDALARVGAGPGTYEVYAAAKFPYAYSQGVDGSLTLGQTGAGTLNANGSNVVRSSPDGQHIYVGVAVANTNNLVVFRRNADNTLTSIQTLSIAGTIADLEISPDGQFVYVGATSLTVYQRAVDGTLTLTGASYAGSPGAALAISPNGQFLFAYDSSSVVTSYSRNLLSGTLRSVNTLSGLSYPQAVQADLVISPDGLNLYASQGSPNGIRQIAVSGGGALSSLGNMTTTNNNIGGLVVSPDGNDLYAVSWSTHNVGHYTRSSLTGQLTFVANVTVTNFGVRLAISPDGRFVYCSVVSSQGVVTFSRAQSGGALTVVQQTAPADGSNWAAVTVAPTLGAVKPTDLEFVGSAGISVSVSSGSVAGGSAQVVIRPSVGGLVTLSGGTATVSDTSVGANTRILLTAQDNNSTGALRISARTPGTSFTITSSNAGDSGVVAYQFWGP